MEFIELLSNQRKKYLEALTMLLNKLEKQGQATLLEPLDEYKDDERNGKSLFSLFRYDILVKSDETYSEVKVHVNPLLLENPTIFKQGNVEISVDSFAWDACSIYSPI